MFGNLERILKFFVTKKLAVLYDYYNPGETSGTLGSVGLGGSEGGKGVLWVHGTGEAGRGECPKGRPSLLFSRAQMFCVLWGTT